MSTKPQKVLLTLFVLPLLEHKLTDCVVASGIVVSSILLASDKLFGMEKLAVGSSSNLVHYSGLQIHEDSPWDKLITGLHMMYGPSTGSKFTTVAWPFIE